MDYDTDDHSGVFSVRWPDKKPFRITRSYVIDKVFIQINESDAFLITLKRMKQAEFDEYRSFMNGNHQWMFIAYITWLSMTKCVRLPEKTPGLFEVPEPFMSFVAKLDRLPTPCREAIFNMVLKANPFINKRNGKAEFNDTWTRTLKE